MADSPRIVDFDHHSIEYGAHGTAILRELRHECPIAYSNSHGGMWVVTNYDHVAEIIKDDATFSSSFEPDTPFQGIVIPTQGSRLRSVPIEFDPPSFFPYRRMLNPWFAPAAVERLEPKLRQVVDAVIDEAIESGRIDLVLELANPVPAIMTMHLLGLPLEDWEIYARPAHEGVYTPPGTPESERVQAEMTAIYPRVLDAIVQRRAAPRENDLLSHLTQVEIEGRLLPDEEVLEIAMLVLLGGVDTTTSLMSNAVLYLHQNRDARQRLIDEPEMRRLACEEFLRWTAPVQTQARTVTHEVELGGYRLQAGDRVLVSWASANRDENVFDQPDDIVLDRYPNRHLSFAVGIHRCIGSNIARTQFLAVLDGVLARLPDYEIDEDQVEHYTSIGMINGIIKMPATFTPGQRVGASILSSAP